MAEKEEMTLKDVVNFSKGIDIIEILDKCEAIDEDELNGRKMLCPFHNEKTPSMNFYEDSYHCFGCGAHGDAISFLENMYDLSFAQAVEMIAEAYSLKLNIGVGYSGNPFIKKNVNPKALEKEWESYIKALEDASDEIKSGAYVFFPLEVGYDPEIRYYVLRYTSKTGRTLGFTKRRAFDTNDKEKFPKWKHSSKAKSNINACGTVYNLGPAIQHIRNTKNVIFVEGPKDTIPWILTKHKEVVAISGASNVNQAFEVLPEFETATLSMDGDEAGKKGTLKLAGHMAANFPLEKVSYAEFGDLDPYDYYQVNKRMPEPSPILDICDDTDLRTLYASASEYNKNFITIYFMNKKKISYSEAESFFAMQPKKARHNKEKEIEELMKSKDPSAIAKLRIKYGVVV